MHIEIRDYVESLMNRGLSADDIAEIIGLKIGTRHIKYSAKWYMYCVITKKNQKQAIEKHPNLYSKAGKIAQQKHPWLGHKLGKKYGSMLGKRWIKKLKDEGNLSIQMSLLAKRLQQINPDHSRLNMKKAHETMKNEGTFNKHQLEAALKCMEKNPHQLKEMSKIAHENYPLALLALESRRRNYPYEFMGCLFDSDSERRMCQTLVEQGLMEKPIEGVNIHFRIKRCHIDFFLKDKVFVEYHPPVQYGKKKGETLSSYYSERREVLNANGYQNYPLIVFDRLRNMETKLGRIKKLIQSPSKLTNEKRL